MTKFLALITLLLLSLMVVSCGGASDDGADGADTTAVELPPILQNGTTLLDLSEYSMPFSLYVPDSMRGVPEISETGYGETQIAVGPTYHVVVAFGGDLAAFRSEMGNDLMYTNTVIEEGDDYVLYKSEIADSFLDPEFHFYAVKSVNGTSFEFHDFNEEGGYAESVCRMMLESVKYLMPIADAS